MSRIAPSRDIANLAVPIAKTVYILERWIVALNREGLNEAATAAGW
jgi:hypothetical protein